MTAEVKVIVDDRGPEGRIVRIEIDRPPLNFLGPSQIAGLTEAIRRASADPQLRALVFTGAGSRAFIGGADVDAMVRFDGPAAETYIRSLSGLCQALRDCPAPTIARINGHCIGGGLEVAAACDLRIASSNGKFGMPEVKLGIPSVIEAALLPRLIGWGRTAEFVLLGENVSAAEIDRWGFLNVLVAPEELDRAVAKAIASILAAGPRAVRRQKALMRRWEDVPLRDAVEAGVDAFARSFESDEPRRMMQAALDSLKARAKNKT